MVRPPLAMPRPEVVAFVALGANLGDANAAVRWAIDVLAALPDTRLVQASSLYRTAPVDASGPDYINAVARPMPEDAPVTRATLPSSKAMSEISCVPIKSSHRSYPGLTGNSVSCPQTCS